MVRVSSLFLPSRQAFLLAYGLYYWFAIALLLTLLFIYLRQWFDHDASLVAVLFVAATMPIALREFQPWSFLEAALFSAALLLILKRRYLALCPLTALAALNRETAYLIPVAMLVTSINIDRPQGRRPLIWVSISGAIWLGIFVGLRLWLGQAPHVLTLKEIWLWNLQPPHPMETILRGSLFLGVAWIFALLGYKHAPPFCKRAALIAVPHIFTIIVWGIWYEVRLLMPLYAVLMPLSLSFLYCRKAPAGD